jgi:methyl-accepting chemotaxis protein
MLKVYDFLRVLSYINDCIRNIIQDTIMGLRLKILSGFMILALMLAIAGAWSIYELSGMGTSVRKILDENYRSIDAARLMNEALEREDSAVLLLQLGQWKEGRQIINTADSMFAANLDFAYSNITIEGEQTALDSIRSNYRLYKSLWERPIVDTEREGSLEWYFNRVHKAFVGVKSAVNNLTNLNDVSMYETATDLQSRANRAIMPGIIAIVAALALTLIFNILVNYLMVSPIIQITRRINDFREKKRPFVVDINTHDELQDLAIAIQDLTDLEISRDIQR